MSTGIWVAAAGAANRATALDVASNNVANATTPGFKADRAVFREYLSKSTGTNVPSQAYRYTHIRSINPDFHVGNFHNTERPLDMAIVDKNAYLAVETPQGERYTRAGNLHVDGRGFLITQGGERVLGANRRAIQLPQTGPAELTKTGEILVGGEPAGRLRFVTIPDPKVLDKQGQNLFRIREGEDFRPRNAQPAVEVGSLELSNKSPVQGMSNLAGSARSFEFLTKVIEAFSEADKRAASEIAGR